MANFNWNAFMVNAKKHNNNRRCIARIPVPPSEELIETALKLLKTAQCNGVYIGKTEEDIRNMNKNDIQNFNNAVRERMSQNNVYMRT